jgi:hypothetical protein
MRENVTPLNGYEDVRRALKYMGFSGRLYENNVVLSPAGGIVYEDGDKFYYARDFAEADRKIAVQKFHAKLSHPILGLGGSGDFGWFERGTAAVVRIDGKVEAIFFGQTVIGNASLVLRLHGEEGGWAIKHPEASVDFVDMCYLKVTEETRKCYLEVGGELLEFDEYEGEKKTVPDYIKEAFGVVKAYFEIERNRKIMKITDDLEIHYAIADGVIKYFPVSIDYGGTVFKPLESKTLLSVEEVRDRIFKKRSLKGIEYKIIDGGVHLGHSAEKRLAIVYKDGYEYELQYDVREGIGEKDILKALRGIEEKKRRDAERSALERLKTKEDVIDALRKLDPDKILRPEISTSVGNCPYGTAEFLNELFGEKRFSVYQIEKNEGGVTVKELIAALEKAEERFALNPNFKRVVASLVSIS